MHNQDDQGRLHRRLEALIQKKLTLSHAESTSSQALSKELRRLEHEIQTTATALGFDEDEVADIESALALEKRGTWIRRFNFPQRLLLAALILVPTGAGLLGLYLTAMERLPAPPSLSVGIAIVAMLLPYVLHLGVRAAMSPCGRWMRAVNKAEDVSGTLHLHGPLGVKIMTPIFTSLMLGPLVDLIWNPDLPLTSAALRHALAQEPERAFLVALGFLGLFYCVSLWITRIKTLVINAQGEIALKYADGFRLRPLHLQDFRHVQSHLHGRSSHPIPTKIVISNLPGGGIRALFDVLPFLRRHHVVLRTAHITTASGGPVNPFALHTFFRRRCQDVGFEIKKPGWLWITQRGWRARRPKSGR